MTKLKIQERVKNVGSPRLHKFSKKTRRILKPQCARMVTSSKFHTEDPHTLEATVQNSFAMAKGRSGFVHPWCSLLFFFTLFRKKFILSSFLKSTCWFLSNQVSCHIWVNREVQMFAGTGTTHAVLIN
jgi:hypothetical protein